MDVNQSILLFECCKIVKGAKSSVIYDLQRDMQRHIPNDLADLLKKYNGFKLNDLLSNFGSDLHTIILENLELLISEEFCFLTDNAANFPPLSTYWNEPSSITNSIVEYSASLEPQMESIISQLNHLGCEHLELRAYDRITIEKLSYILSLFQGSRILSITLMIPYIEDVDIEDYKNIVDEFPRIACFRLHSSPENRIIEDGENGFGSIELAAKTLNSNIHCGNIGRDHFAVNTKLFTEALVHNTCLNRKISIDAEGNIKNCPSTKESFGNIRDTSLSKVIGETEFTKYWNINKDKILVCKDCEFRYMCHDCRAYVEDPKDILSKPLKCGYNPYKGEWNEWSTNPLKQKAIEFYGMREMVVDNIEIGGAA